MPRLSRVVWLWVAGAAALAVAGCIGIGAAVIVDRTLIFVGASWAALVLAMAWCARRRSARPLFAPLQTLAQLIAISVIGAFLQYPTARTGRPLIDSALASVDCALWFDWPASFTWVLRHPVVLTVLSAIYLSLGLQSLLLCVVALRQPDRARTCLAANVLTLTCCLVAFAVWPAGGAFAYYRPDGIVSDYVTQLMAVRSGPITTLALGQMKGIIQFPSYHAAAAVLLGYAFAGSARWIAAPAIVVEITLTISAVPIGGHHLVDVLAGLALGGISLALAHACARGGFRALPQAVLAAEPAVARRAASTRWIARTMPR